MSTAIALQQKTAYDIASETGDILVIEDFVHTQFPAIICLEGFSGGGKTKSAIKIAKGMMKVLKVKTMFMDTENKRGKMYARDVEGADFSYTELTPPFTPERYIAAIKQVERAGYGILIIDSGSHEWDGLGGMLDIADANVKKDGEQIRGKAKWSVKSRHKKFMSTMLAGRMHVIICLRAKDKYVKKIVDSKMAEIIEGFIPLQERNFKYDLMIQLPMPEGGKGRYIMDETQGFKCPGELLDAFKAGEQVTEEMGVKIAEWIATGKTVDELLRQLKADATTQAENGVEHFRSWWKTLPREKQIQLTPFLPNLESIAKTVDAENEDDEPQVVVGKRNEAGTDIGSLIDQPVNIFSIPVEPPKRHAEDSDWWSIIDQLTPSLMKCSNIFEYNNFVTDNAPAFTSLAKSPPRIHKEWETLVVIWQKGLAALKAA